MPESSAEDPESSEVTVEVAEVYKAFPVYAEATGLSVEVAVIVKVVKVLSKPLKKVDRTPLESSTGFRESSDTSTKSIG